MYSSSILTLTEVKALLFGNKKMTVDNDQMTVVAQCYDFLKQFSQDKVIYGINTGFGPMAQYRIADADLLALQYNIIRSHATGAGRPIPPLYIKAAMIARLNTFLQGKSGVHPELVALLTEFINRDIVPVVPEHGSVGASGDLVQLAHISLALIGEGEVFYRGERCRAADVMDMNDLRPFKVHIREGLSVSNGTSVMTGIGLVNLIYARKLLHYAVAASVMMNEIAESYDDLMSETLNATKQHNGQQDIATAMRRFAEGSQRLRSRAVELYEQQHEERIFDHKVQPYYSLRCVPQILGPVLDTIEQCEKVVVDELNSVDDNPIVDPETQSIYHGGNFHGDYVSLEMDKLKIAMTKLTMLMERQLNYLCHDRVNGILPPFLNMGTLGLNYGIQAMQFTATSTTAECQTLSNSMYVHSIPNNNDNQDIVSMGTNSALMAKQVIENSFQVMSIHLIAIAQAVDCLKIADRLSPQSKELYTTIRKQVAPIVEDRPHSAAIEAIEKLLKNDW